MVWRASLLALVLAADGVVCSFQHSQHTAVVPGGIASIDIPIRPKHELFVALAGPAVNVVLIPVFLLMPDCNFCTTLGYYNVMLLVFNMLPALPMDGGRAFRAILALCLKDHLRATIVAARISQGLCLGLTILGMIYGTIMLIVIAFFIAMAAQSEISGAEMRRVASDITGREIHDSAEALRIIRQKIEDHRRQYG